MMNSPGSLSEVDKAMGRVRDLWRFDIPIHRGIVAHYHRGLAAPLRLHLNCDEESLCPFCCNGVDSLT